MIGISANVMIVPNARPWKTVADFMRMPRRSPVDLVRLGRHRQRGAYQRGKFRLAAGVETTHVPYRGGSEVIADILGGRVDFYFCPLAPALPLIRAGQVRALLVSTVKRVPDCSDVPTPQEAGLKGAESAIWFGVFVPAKTPRDTIEKFHAAGMKVLSDPATQGRAENLGIEPLPMTPKQMDELVVRELVDNQEVVKARHQQSVHRRRATAVYPSPLWTGLGVRGYGLSMEHNPSPNFSCVEIRPLPRRGIERQGITSPTGHSLMSALFFPSNSAILRFPIAS